jgi:hypothetical protein
MSDNAELRKKSTGAGWVQIYREPVSIDEAEPFAMLYRQRTRVVYGTAELVVSTAGRMRQDMPGKTVQGKYMPFGLGDTGQRYYETIVFVTNNPGDPLETGLNWTIEWVDETSDRLANNQHEAAVSWAEEAIKTGMYEVGQ